MYLNDMKQYFALDYEYSGITSIAEETARVILIFIVITVVYY